MSLIFKIISDTELNALRGPFLVRSAEFKRLNVGFAFGPGEVSDTEEFLVHNDDVSGMREY